MRYGHDPHPTYLSSYSCNCDMLYIQVGEMEMEIELSTYLFAGEKFTLIKYKRLDVAYMISLRARTVH